MAIYTVTAANWNDPAFWSSISEAGSGHSLDFSDLPSNFSIDYDPDLNRLIISDGTSSFTVGDATYGGVSDADLGGSTLFSNFTTIIGTAGADWAYGGSANETLVGGAGNDTLLGYYGDDSISGGDGDDSIRGEYGNDTIDGGAGSDTVQASGFSDADVVMGGESTDDVDVLDLVGTAEAKVAFSGDEAGTYSIGTASGTFSQFEEVRGGEGSDKIDASASSVSQTLKGEAGNDSLAGGSGADSIDGGSGTDSIFAGAGDDTIDGGGNTDTIHGGAGNDDIRDTGGNLSDDTIYGDAGNDTIAGGRREDYLDGGDDADTFLIENGFGNDTIVGGEGGTDFDTIDLSALTGPVTVTYTGDGAGTITDGVDTISFSEIEKIILTENADVVDASADTSGIEIVGLGGDDTITTGSGNDTIDAGAGADNLTTGAGEDIIVLADGAGADTVTDFDTGDANGDGRYNDQFDVSGMTADDGGTIGSWDVTTADDGAGNARLQFPASTSNSTMTMQSTSTSQMDEGAEYRAAGVPCFTPGTLIRTVRGDVPVERLRIGDMILTRDNGPQPLLWLATRVLGADDLGRSPNCKPVEIATGAFGKECRLVVSPQHGMLLRLDGEEIFVRATHLATLAGGGARRLLDCRQVTYFHLLLERHEVIFSNGVPSESFFPGPQALKGLDARNCRALASLFPGIGGLRTRVETEALYGTSARAYVRRRMLPQTISAFDFVA